MLRCSLHTALRTYALYPRPSIDHFGGPLDLF
jgi:hypothetical protein